MAGKSQHVCKWRFIAWKIHCKWWFYQIYSDIMFSRGYLHKSRGLLLCCVPHQDAHQDHFKCTKMVPFWEKASCKCRSKRILTERCTLSAGLPYSFLSLAQDLAPGPVPNQTHITAASPAFPTSDLSEVNGLTVTGKTNRSNQRFPNLTSGNRMKIIGGHHFPVNLIITFMDGSWMVHGFCQLEMETTEVATGMLPSLTGGPHKSS